MGKIDKYCDICGKEWATDNHHLIGSTSDRRICDKYPSMQIQICRHCHEVIHQNNTANKLSKMLGQAIFENNYTRKEYLKLFKKNYLPIDEGNGKG